MGKEYNDVLEFKPSEKNLSLGIELELQVLDSATLLLTPKAQELLDACKLEKLDHEFFQSTIEIRTDVCDHVDAAERDLVDTLSTMHSVAGQLGLSLGSTGTHPAADYRERLITRSERYDELIDRNQWIAKRMAVYGMHVHIGMGSGDSCLQYGYFFMHLLPHVFALSASSPFWQGKNTGLIACRPTTYEALPTAGLPYFVRDWNAFQRMYSFLLKSKSIGSMKDLWWDVRPSPGYGTIELRFCDEPATLFEVKAIAAFIHLLAHWYEENGSAWSNSHAPLKQWIFRENKWRTLRYGLDADVIVTRTGKIKSLRTDILDWLKKLKPYAERLGYQQQVDMIREIVMKGNSSQRQFRVFENTNDLQAVVEHNVREFSNGHPDWS